MNSPRVVLVTGGSRSGKTACALELAMQYDNRVYIATAEATDAEMANRIRRHREERADRFRTIEEPLDLAEATRRIPKNTGVALIDCLTVWLGNLMHKRGVNDYPRPEISAFLDAIEAPPCNLVIVTNEVGSGIVPHDAMTRAYRDHAGWLNQNVAAIAHEVHLTISGIPLKIKG